MASAVQLPVVVGPSLTAEQAREIYARGEEAVIFAMLELAAQLRRAEGRSAAVSSPATPSGMRPIIRSAHGKRRKKPAQGWSRGTPAAAKQIDERKERGPSAVHSAGGSKRRRNPYALTEDIPAGIQPVVTEHTIHRDWCPHCKKSVEPRVPDALPGGQIGNRVVVLSSWLHYGLGNTLSQIVEVFNQHLHFQVTPGGLMQQWYRLQEILFPWYEQIQAEARNSAVLHADETGWRVNGKGTGCGASPRRATAT
jgi:transposase